MNMTMLPNSFVDHYMANANGEFVKYTFFFSVMLRMLHLLWASPWSQIIWIIQRMMFFALSVTGNLSVFSDLDTDRTVESLPLNFFAMRKRILVEIQLIFRLYIKLSSGFNPCSDSCSSGNRVPIRSCFCTGRKQYPDSGFQCGSSWYIPCPEGDQVSPVHHGTVPWQDTDAYGCRHNYLFLWYTAYVCWSDWISDWILCRERT